MITRSTVLILVFVWEVGSEFYHKTFLDDGCCTNVFLKTAHLIKLFVIVSRICHGTLLSTPA